MKLITVLMSTYNESEAELKTSIESILNQTYSLIEFIIVNDNPSNKMLAQILDLYQKKDQRIRVVENDKNMGLVASLNRGWQMASGEYIARMDADDIALPERLEKQLAFLETNRYDFVGAGIQYVDEDGDIISSVDIFPEKPNDIREMTKKSNCVPHPTWLMKKTVIDALNGYRNVRHCEDFDFILRAQHKGFLLGNLQELGLYYRVRANGISQSNWVIQKLTADFLAANWSRIDSCSLEEIQEYLNSKQTIQYGTFLACQRQGFIDNLPSWKKAVHLFSNCWNNPYFWTYICERLCRPFTQKR